MNSNEKLRQLQQDIEYKAKELAICYRKEQISRLNSAGMDYSNRNILQIGKD